MERILIFIFLFFSFNFNARAGDENCKLEKSDILIGTSKRTFMFFKPDSQKAPLLFMLHGGGGKAKNFIRLDNCEMIRLAEKNGFFLIYPDGLNKRWNDGRDESFSSSEDVKFIQTLIDEFISRGADKNKIFIAGISNGGFMAFRLAKELNDKIKGIATISSGIQKKMIQDKNLFKRPIDVLVISGDKDPLIPKEGGTPQKRFLIKRGLKELLSLEEVKKFWIETNKCFKKTEELKLDLIKTDETAVSAEKYECAQNSKNHFYIIENGGHAWPGGKKYLPEFIIGKTTKEIEATQTIADFFALKKN